MLASVILLHHRAPQPRFISKLFLILQMPPRTEPSTPQRNLYTPHCTPQIYTWANSPPPYHFVANLTPHLALLNGPP